MRGNPGAVSDRSVGLLGTVWCGRRGCGAGASGGGQAPLFPAVPHQVGSAGGAALSPRRAAASRCRSWRHTWFGRHAAGCRPADAGGAGGGGAPAQHGARHHGQPVVWQPGRVSRGGRILAVWRAAGCAANAAMQAACLSARAATVRAVRLPGARVRPAQTGPALHCCRLRSDRHYATATALTKEALAEVIDKLLEVSGCCCLLLEIFFLLPSCPVPCNGTARLCCG